MSPPASQKKSQDYIDQSQESETLRVITPEELKKNNVDNVWIVIDGFVYDVTRWVPYHPGGELSLRHMSGRDATDLFLAFHPERTKGILKKFLIGKLSEYEPSQLTLAFRQFRTKVLDAGLMETDYGYFVQKFAQAFMILFCAIYLTVWTQTVSLQLFGGLLLALWFQQVAFLGHDSAHNGVTHDRATDSSFGLIIGNLTTGISCAWWKRSHNVHHIYTNCVQHDPDIQHLPALAITDSYFQSLWSFYHERIMSFDAVGKFLVKYQVYLFYPLMAVARFNLYAQSWMLLFSSKPVERKTAEIVTLSLFLVGLSYLISCLPTWETRLLYLLISHCPAGILHIQITLSHFAMSLYSDVPYKLSEDDLLLTQMNTTMDIATPEWFDWFHGGLQFQLEHHLFPRIPRHNLRRLRTLFIDFCKEHNLKRQEMGFFEANLATLKLLSRVSSSLEKEEMSFAESPLSHMLNAQG